MKKLFGNAILLKRISLLSLATFLVLVSVATGVLGFIVQPPQKTYAAVLTNEDAIRKEAVIACGKNAGLSSQSDYDKYANTSAGKACINGFMTSYPPGTSPSTISSYCEKHYPSASKPREHAACTNGIQLGTAARTADEKEGGGSASKPTDSKIISFAKESSVCQLGSTEAKNSCIAGYIAGYKGTPPKSTACKSGAKISGFKVSDEGACLDGYRQGAKDKGAATPGATFTPATGTTKTDDNQLGCDKNGNALSWIICPIVDVLVGFISAIDNIITAQLDVDTSNVFCERKTTCNDYYSAWRSFRNIALGLMLIAGLVVVISQALGIEILDAYTLRKTLPRILVAAVGITLSWPLMKFFVVLTNDLGVGIRHLIYAPFSNLSTTIHFSKDAGDLFFGGVATGTLLTTGTSAVIFTLAGGLGAMLAYLGTAALAVLIAIVVLALRQVAVIMLMLLAPVAIVAYVLPNTQKIYKLWWDSFSKALLMFPLIAAFIASGRVFSAIALNAGGTLNDIIGFLSYFAPYFLIPLTFKFAGGFVRQLGGFVNDRGKGGFDRLRGFRDQRRKAGFKRIQDDNLYRNARPGSRRERLNSAWSAAARANPDEIGANPLKWRENARALRERGRIKGGLEGLENHEAFAPVKGDDDVAHAILSGNARKYLTDTGKFSEDEINRKMAHIDLARRAMGEANLRQAAIMSAVSASTGYSQGGIGQLISDIDMVAGDDAEMRAQLIGQVKQRAVQSGRTDLSAPFAEMYEASKRIGTPTEGRTRQQQIEAESHYLLKKTIDTEGAGYVAGGKGAALEKFLPVLQERMLDTATNAQVWRERMEQSTNPNLSAEQQRVFDADGNEIAPEIIEQQSYQADRELMQAAAATKALHDITGQISPEKARLLADGVLGHQMPGYAENVSVLDWMNANIDNKEFNEMRNEFRSQYGRQLTEQQTTQAAAGAAAAAAAAAAPGAMPGPLPPPSPT
jgi:hypothetical protein